MSDVHMNPTPDHNPPSDQPPEWEQQHHPDKESMRNRNTIIGVAGGVVALTIAGGALAYNLTMNPTGDRPFQVLPAAGIALYAEVNLDPSKDQKEAYLSLSDKFDELGVEGMDIKESLSTTLSDDYSEVEPWIGDRFAAAAYADQDGNGKTEAFTLYQIADEGKAETYADTLDRPHRIIGQYLILGATSTSQETLDAFTSDEATLASDDTFNQDLGSIKNDSVALAWIDLSSNLWAETTGGALGSPRFMPPTPSDLPQVQGRVIADMKLNKNGAQAEFRTVGLTVDGKTLNNFYEGDTVSSEFSALSADSQVAFSVSGLDSLLTQMWDQGSMREVTAGLDNTVRSMGINLPEDFTGLLGSVTSGGVSLDAFGPSGELRMQAGDSEMISDLLTTSGVDVNVADLDGTTLVSVGGVSTADRIGDSQEILDVLPDLAQATSAGYFDLDGLNRAMGNKEGEGNTVKSLGHVGVTVVPDKDDLVTSIHWVVK